MKKSLFALIILGLAISITAGWDESAALAAPVSLQSPSPTPTVTPTLAPLAGGIVFNQNSANRVSPEDVFAEMTIFTNGGGEDDLDECLSSSPAEVEDQFLMDVLGKWVCWPEQEPVALRVIRPGRPDETSVLQPKDGKVWVYYRPGYDDPVVTYTLVLAEAKRKFEIRVQFSQPNQPRLMEVPGSPFTLARGSDSPRRNLILQHFAPGEKVRLYAYDYPRILAWQELVIPASGNLPVNVDLEAVSQSVSDFGAVGEQSGSVTLSNHEHGFTVLRCPGAKRSRFVDDPNNGLPDALVAYTGGKKLAVYQSPGFKSPKIGSIPEGTELDLGSVQCADGAWFWEIDSTLTESLKGWVAEAEDGVYRIEPLRIELHLAALDEISAGGVLAEMYVFGSGAGTAASCQLVPAPMQADRYLLEPLILPVCWPEADDRPTLKVLLPDGKMETASLRPENGQVMVEYQPGYAYPSGKYVLRLEGSKRTIEFQVNFLSPNQPRLLSVWDRPISPFIRSYYLILDHFAPGEKVRLYAYRRAGDELQILGWQELTVRSDGRMLVVDFWDSTAGSDPVFFAALGERSGEVHYLRESIRLSFRSSIMYEEVILEDPVASRSLFCPGAKPARLRESGRIWFPAVVSYTDGTRLRLHQSPGFISPTIGLIPEGTRVEVSGPATCADGNWFWNVGWNSMKGWVAEAQNGVYLLEPAPEPTPALTPTAPG